MNYRIAIISLSLFMACIKLDAQSADAVPVPSQFATAQTAFLASASAPGVGGRETLIAQIIYSSLYKSLSSGGQYRLVSAPADSELSMIISAHAHVSSVVNGSSFDATYLRLEVYDVKTHTLLWALDEPIQGAFRQKTFQKNVDKSIASLNNDLKQLASGAVPGDAASSTPQPIKTSISSEKK